jgi:hypothetical protein
MWAFISRLSTLLGLHRLHVVAGAQARAVGRLEHRKRLFAQQYGYNEFAIHFFRKIYVV